jgi:hypothetical protein
MMTHPLFLHNLSVLKHRDACLLQPFPLARI